MSHEESSHHPPRNKSAVQCILNTSPVCLWSITLICLCQFYSYAFIIPVLIPAPVCVAVCVCASVVRERERRSEREWGRDALYVCAYEEWYLSFGLLEGPHFPTPSTLYVIPQTAPPAIHCSPSNHSAQQPGRTDSLCAAPSISPLRSESTA